MQVAPNATLAISSSCPHCPGMLETFSQLVKKGQLAEIQVVNISSSPDFVQQFNIRSVPWMKIGPFILTGLHTAKEINHWIGLCSSEEGIKTYFQALLSNGELDSVTQAIKYSPEIIRQLIPLISSDETNINVRLGLGAILEDLSGNNLLTAVLDDLIALLAHKNNRIRGDAAHFLSFIHSQTAIPALQQLLDDPDPELREIAAESIEALTAN